MTGRQFGARVREEATNRIGEICRHDEPGRKQIVRQLASLPDTTASGSGQKGLGTRQKRGKNRPCDTHPQQMYQWLNIPYPCSDNGI